VPHLPQVAQDQLKAFVDAMSNCTVVYTRSQSGRIPKSYDGPETYSAQFSANKFVQRADVPQLSQSGKRAVSHQEIAFDGATFYFGVPEIAEGDVPAVLFRFQPGDDTEPDRFAQRIQIPYFDAICLAYPKSVEALRQSKLRSLVLDAAATNGVSDIKAGTNDHILRVTVEIPDDVAIAMQNVDIEENRKRLNTGRNSQEFIDREMAMIGGSQKKDPKRIVTFVLDAQMGYAVIERTDLTEEGKTILHCENTDWKYYNDSGIWLPGVTVTSYFTFPSGLTEFFDKPLITYKCELRKIAFGVAESQVFSLDYSEPGTIVNDRSTAAAKSKPDHQVRTIVSATEDDLRAAAENARPKGGLIIVNMVVLLVVCVVCWLVRRRNRLVSKS